MPLGLRPHPKSCAPLARVLTKPGCAGPGCSTALQPRSKRLRPSASGRPDLPRKRGTLRALRHRINHARRVLRPRRPLNRARSAPWKHRLCCTTVKRSSKGRGEAFRDGHDGLKGLKWPRRRPAKAFSCPWVALTPTHPGKIACSAFYAVDFSAEQLRVMVGQTSADDG